jgi:hypothetical protein
MYTELKKFSASLKNDSDLLLGWHSNIAMWLHDYCGVMGYDLRNKLACKFINHFLGIDYDWKKLMNGELNK